MKKLKLFSAAIFILLFSKSFSQEISKSNIPGSILEKKEVQNEKKENRIYNDKNLSALIVINGTKSTENILKSINAENIESINILKYDAAAALYSRRGQNGVILIQTKNLSKKEMRKLKKRSESEYREPEY